MAASNNKKTFARTLTLSAIAATVLAACDSGPATIALSDRCTVATQITNNTAAATASVSGSLSSMVTSGTAVRYELVTAPSNGSLSIGATSGGYLYTTASTSRGFSDSFSVRAIGAEGNVATATYTVIFGNRRIMPLGDSITFGVTRWCDRRQWYQRHSDHHSVLVQRADQPVCRHTCRAHRAIAAQCHQHAYQRLQHRSRYRHVNELAEPDRGRHEFGAECLDRHDQWFNALTNNGKVNRCS